MRAFQLIPSLSTTKNIVNTSSYNILAELFFKKKIVMISTSTYFDLGAFVCDSVIFLFFLPEFCSTGKNLQ